MVPTADAHYERARRAQQLGDRARECAGAEREAVERSERLMAEATDPVLAALLRRAAEVHRQLLQHYENAAELERMNADHERRAAERARTIDSGRDAGARDAAADRRDMAADDRDRLADVRDQTADQRDRRAGERESMQDARDERQDAREHRYEEITGHPIRDASDRIAASRASLRRKDEDLTRGDAKRERAVEDARREQATVDRESATTARREPPAATD